MNKNNKSILDIHNLRHCYITIELQMKANSVPQCSRCQDYGHMKNDCTKTVKCVKYGERHSFKKCNSPKCANCKGAHIANYRGCPYYQAKISSMKEVKITSAVDRIKKTTVSPALVKVGI